MYYLWCGWWVWDVSICSKPARGKLLQSSRYIYEWNYEIIRWTVKLINMMTYFITSQNSRYYANILMCKLPPPNEANAILQSNILILPRCFSLSLWESLASCQITYVFIFPIASSSLYSSMIYSKCNGIKKNYDKIIFDTGKSFLQAFFIVIKACRQCH